MIKKLNIFYFEEVKDFTLEQKYLFLISSFTSVSLTLSIIACFLLNNLSFAIVCSISALIFITSYLLIRYKRYFHIASWLMLFNGIGFTDFCWFYFDGSKGSSFFVITIAAVCAFLVLKKVERLLSMIVILINMGVLFYIEYNYPHLIESYSSGLHRILNLSVTFCLCVFVLLAFISSVINSYTQAMIKAEREGKFKSVFLANISHEIRTPMNAIMGFSRLINKPDITSNERTIFSDYICSSCEGLKKIIDNIINITKIELKDYYIRKTKSNINEILNFVYHYFTETNSKLIKPDVEFIINKDSLESNIYVKTDPVQLQQILIYLIDNALKFTHKGYIEYGYTNENTHLLFYVKDTGIGVPETQKEFIFKRFSKVQGIYDKQYSGVGLGLTIAKNLIELLGGKIWVESEESYGTTFYFTLPIN